MDKPVEIESWQRLNGKVSASILVAPKTGGDSEGNFPKVHSKIVTYLERSIVGKPWGDHLTLIAAIRIAKRLDVKSVLSELSTINNRFIDLFQVLSLQDMNDWNANKYIPAYLKGELLKDSLDTRMRFYKRYGTATKAVWQWFESLSEKNKQIYQQFLLPRLNRELVEGLIRRREIDQRRQQKRKLETDALMPQYANLRKVAHLRYNKIVRLRAAWYKALETVKTNQCSLPKRRRESPVSSRAGMNRRSPS